MKMAAEFSEDDCLNFVNMKFIDNVLYFIHNLESDYFGKLIHRLSIIRNLDDQILFVDRGKQPLFEDMPDSDSNSQANVHQTTFTINLYKDSEARGMAVTLSVTSNQVYTLSCENKTISFKEMNPPDHINDIQSDIIFFQRSVPGHDDKMQFESSLYNGYFLACQKVDNIYKLTLKEKDEYGDKSVMFTVQNEGF
ncbi:interleukin-18 [Ctenodactylus gundi]